MTLKSLLPLSLILALPCGAARHLSPSEALGGALKGKFHRIAPVADLGKYELVASSETESVYAFNVKDGGFAIISAYEDAAFPILGYSDTGSIDADNIPDGLRWFMDNVAADNIPVSKGNDYRLEDIAPLVTSRWSQDAPFNSICPVQNGTVTYVGCVATAISQILFHPSNRMQPAGEYSYAWPTYGTPISFDYDANPFRYDLMLDDYSGDFTPEQGEAVANFCHGVGVACNMDYGWMQSGCNQYDAADALIYRLGADNGMALVFRDFYEAHEWAELIHSRLAKNMPVMYIGVSTVGAHAFIADGYQGEEGDYFHINWGWGGMSDGYFLLSALLPEKLGIGGGSGHDGFNSNQMAYLDICPAKEGSKPAPTIYMTGMFCAEFEDAAEEYINFSCQHGLSSGPGIFSYALDTVYGGLGMKLVDVSTGEVSYVGQSEDLEFLVYHGYISFTIDSSAFPTDGEYIVSPVFVRDDIRYDIIQDIETRNELHLICDNGKRQFKSVDISHRVVAENLELNGISMDSDISAIEIVRSKSFPVKVDLRAQNVNYSGAVYPVLLDDNGYIAAKMSRQVFELNDGESITLEWNEKFVPTLAEGNYSFTLLNAEDLVLYELTTLPVVKTASVATVETSTNYEFYDLQGRKAAPSKGGKGIYIRKSATGTVKIAR